ncbi:MAG: hypothetical protein ACTXOO_05850 [Sodalis sp. (in: enterobacteria)]
MGISKLTVSKWKKRDGIEDYGHIRHRLQATLSLDQQAVVCFPAEEAFLSLGNLLAVSYANS